MGPSYVPLGLLGTLKGTYRVYIRYMRIPTLDRACRSCESLGPKAQGIGHKHIVPLI